MFGFVRKIGKALTLYNEIKDVIEEGKDVVIAADRIQSKYSELPADVQDAWDEVRELIDAIKRVG